MYTSINVNTGKPVHDIDHFLQCASQIVTTPIGTRVMRRHFGSESFSIVDSPDNASSRLRLMAAAATALLRWENRLSLSRINVVSGNAMGKVQFAVDGAVTIGNARYVLEGALIG